MTEWNLLSEPVQIQLATEAMRQATNRLAGYAEVLAAEMEAGAVPDWGGQEALRLFANLVRSVHAADQGIGHGVGHA